MSERGSKFSVGEPRAYDSATKATRQAPSSTQTKHAVVVVHGMGQQTTFETVSALAEVLCGEDGKSGSASPAIARSVQVGDQRLSRLEVTTTDRDGKQHEVHLFEAYWAPLTEGRVSTFDVLRFLFHAGIGGLRSSLRKTFPRWAFGRLRRFDVSRKTWIGLCAVLFVMLSLMAMNAALLFTLAGRVLSPGTAGAELFPQLDAIAAILALFTLTLFATLNGASRLRTRLIQPRFAPFFSAAGWAHAGLTGLSVLAAGTLMLAVATGPSPWLVALAGQAAKITPLVSLLCFITVAFIVGSFALRPGVPLLALTHASIAWSVVSLSVVVAAFEDVVPIPSYPLLHALWGGWFLLGATVVLRQVLVQFVGDVAVYVTPQSLDKFNDLREEIKACVLGVGSAVYRASHAGKLEYDNVTIVGHSLGSVAAYDMLNRLLRDDDAGVTTIDVEGRTRGLLTFGSPLDKTTFLFGMQHQNEAAHALAATVQPLIQRRDCLEWINLHSPNDVVSGSLEYFDDRGGCARVTNLRDPQATTPLVAHVEYWTNDLLATCLRHLVTTRFPSPIVVQAVAPSPGWSALPAQPVS